MPEHYLVFGVSLRLALLSSPDRRSTWDRRSPVNRFSSSERVSFPDRLSLVVRLSPDRFRSSPIACLRRLSRIKPGWCKTIAGCGCAKERREG
jgi:hypothetical protein